MSECPWEQSHGEETLTMLAENGFHQALFRHMSETERG